MNKKFKVVLIIFIFVILVFILASNFFLNIFILSRIYLKNNSFSLDSNNFYFEETIDTKSLGISNYKYYFKDNKLKIVDVLNYTDEYLKDFNNDIEKSIQKIYYKDALTNTELCSVNGNDFENSSELVSYQDIIKELENNLKLPKELKLKDALFDEIDIEENCYKIKNYIGTGYIFINKDNCLVEKYVSDENSILFTYSNGVVKDIDVNID